MLTAEDKRILDKLFEQTGLHFGQKEFSQNILVTYFPLQESSAYKLYVKAWASAAKHFLASLDKCSFTVSHFAHHHMVWITWERAFLYTPEKALCWKNLARVKAANDFQFLFARACVEYLLEKMLKPVSKDLSDYA